MYQTVLSFGIANPSNPAALTATVAQSFISKFIAAIDCAGVSANEDMELELVANINSLPISEEVKESALAAILYFDQFGFGKKQTATTKAHCAAINALLCAVYKAEYHNEVAEQQNQPSELPAENMQETEQKADFSLPTCNLFAAAPYNTALSNNTKTNFCSMLAPADEKRYGQKRPFFEKDGYSPQDLAIIKDWVEPVRQGSDIRQMYWYETEGDPKPLLVDFRVERVKDDDGGYAYELELTDESAIVLPKDYVCPAAYAKTKGEQRKFLLTSIKEFLQDRFYQALRILK